jgi:hypothetical protein
MISPRKMHPIPAYSNTFITSPSMPTPRRSALIGIRKVHNPSQNQCRYRDTQKNQCEGLKIEQGDFHEKKGAAPEHRKDDQQPPLLWFH